MTPQQIIVEFLPLARAEWERRECAGAKCTSCDAAFDQIESRLDWSLHRDSCKWRRLFRDAAAYAKGGKVGLSGEVLAPDATESKWDAMHVLTRDDAREFFAWCSEASDPYDALGRFYSLHGGRLADVRARALASFVGLCRAAENSVSSAESFEAVSDILRGCAQALDRLKSLRGEEP